MPTFEDMGIDYPTPSITLREYFDPKDYPKPSLANFSMATLLANECFPTAYKVNLDVMAVNLCNTECKFIPIYKDDELYFAFLSEEDGHYVADAKLKDVDSVCDMNSPWELPKDCSKVMVQPIGDDRLSYLKAHQYHILMTQRSE